MKTLLIAGSFQEASRYAAGKELRSWRFASTAEDAASYRPERIVRLPGSAKRATNHAVEALVKRLVRQNPRIEVVEDSYARPTTPVPQYGDADYRADLLFGDAPVPLYDKGGFLAAGESTAVEAAGKLQDLGLAGRPQDKPVRKSRKPVARSGHDLDNLFEES